MPKQILWRNSSGEMVVDLNLARANAEIMEALRKTNEKNAHIVKTNVDAETPVGPTGNLLKGSEVYQSKYEKTDYIVHNKAPHAALVNLGSGQRSTKTGKNTGTMPPNPFFRRAVEKVRDELIKNFEGILGD